MKISKANSVYKEYRQTLAYKEKISDAKSKPWIITDLNGNKIDVPKLKKFADENGLNYNSLKNHGKSLGYLCERGVR